MRHRIHQRKLNRTSGHRRALHRNMAQNLIEHGKITTTLPKAKDIRPYVEKLVTLAVKVRRLATAKDHAGSLRARRRIHKMLGERSLVPEEHQETYENMSDAARAKSLRMVSGRRYRTGEARGRLAFTGESVAHRLIETIAPRFEDRPGGYTRLIQIAKPRIGDNTRLAVIQFVGEEEPPGSLTKPGKSARKRRADARYALAIKLGKQWSGKGSEASKKKEQPPVEEDTAVSEDTPAGDSQTDDSPAE